MRLLAALALVLPLAAQAPLAANADVQAQIRLFEAWLRGQMSYRALPGVSVGVIFGEQLVYSQGFGFADVENKTALTPATPFRMASHTKLFTAVAVMQLRDQGKLRLDDPVSTHLPWFQIKPATEDDGPIRIEHLLTHSSGLPREAASPYWVTFEFPSYEDVRRLLPGQQAALATETRWKYSNLALSVAGLIVEKVSGERWALYVRNHILKPLGMTASSIDENVAGLAVGYGRRMPDGSRQSMPFTDTKGIGPAAGLTSTVQDMARFVSFQFRKADPVLKASTLREMHRPRMLEQNWTRANGLGFAVSRIDGKSYYGHGGSLAGYKTHTYFRLDDQTGVVVLSNADDARPNEIALRLFQTVGEAVSKAANPPKPKPAWDPSWTRFTGLYRSIWGDSEVVELNGRLVLLDPLAENPTDHATLEPLGNGVFRLEAPAGGAAIGEQVRFVEQNGAVVRMITGNTYADRVSR